MEPKIVDGYTYWGGRRLGRTALLSIKMEKLETENAALKANLALFDTEVEELDEKISVLCMENATLKTSLEEATAHLAWAREDGKRLQGELAAQSSPTPADGIPLDKRDAMVEPPEHNPLARRMVVCPVCKGTGKEKRYRMRFPKSLESDAYEEDCPPCMGTGLIPEPAEVWAERLKGMLEYAIEELAHYWTGHTDAEAKQYVIDAAMKYYTARLLAAEKATGG